MQLGTGTGCVTRALLRRMRPDARLVGVELNPVFVAECSHITDGRFTLRQDCASSLLRLVNELGLGEIDCIVSCLPLAIMDDTLVERILAVTHASLGPEGTFVQYQYSLRHRRALEERYPEVRLDFTLRNIPPAFVYACSREPVTA